MLRLTGCACARLGGATFTTAVERGGGAVRDPTTWTTLQQVALINSDCGTICSPNINA